MTKNRRFYKRTRTIERIFLQPDASGSVYEKRSGENFRVEISNDSGETIYVNELFGTIEIEERPNGSIQILGGNLTGD